MGCLHPAQTAVFVFGSNLAGIHGAGAALIEQWRKKRSRCDLLARIRSTSVYVQFIFSVILLVLSLFSFVTSQFVLFVFIFLVAFFVLFSFFTGRILRRCSGAEIPGNDDLAPASPDDLAKLSVFLSIKAIKVYLQKVAQQQRPLMRMEYRMLISSPDALQRDAQRQAHLALVEREAGLRVTS